MDPGGSSQMPRNIARESTGEEAKSFLPFLSPLVFWTPAWDPVEPEAVIPLQKVPLQSSGPRFAGR